MPASKEYVAFILDQLAPLGEELTTRTMMGECMIYYRAKLTAYICDDRLLVKLLPAARRLLPCAPEELPYPGAKPMLLVEEVDDARFLCRLFEALWEELPAPKPKRKK
ncbi:MAG: competence protein TfoX [Christensenellaceae bacterium]|nr:competence protein TfoX [Christensenellaceae bacterium]